VAAEPEPVAEAAERSIAEPVQEAWQGTELRAAQSLAVRQATKPREPVSQPPAAGPQGAVEAVQWRQSAAS
jgi:hypothetical protein